MNYRQKTSVRPIDMIAPSVYRTGSCLRIVLLIIGILGLQLIAAAKETKPATRLVYVANRDSRNLSAFHVNAATGGLTPVAGSPFAVEMAPKTMVASHDGRFLYITGDRESAIWAFAVDERGGLTAVEGSPFETTSVPGDMAADASGKHLYAASRDGVLAFAIDTASGRLSQANGSPFVVGHEISGIAVDPADRWVYVSDASEKSVLTMAVDEITGALRVTGDPVRNAAVEPGKLALSSSGKSLLVADRGTDAVAVFSVNLEHGALNRAAESPMAEVRSPGDVALIGDGVGFVVASSDGAGFTVNAQTVSSVGTFALGVDASERYLYAADMDSNSVTRYQIDAKSQQVISGSGLKYGTGDGPVAMALINGVQPQVTGAITVSLTSGSLLTFASTSGDVHLSAAAVAGSDTSCAGQVIQLSFSVPSIAVISTAAANPATSVCVPTGKQDSAFTVTTAANSGSATLTAFATGFTDGTTSLGVSQRQITLSLPYTNVGVGRTVNGTVTLANPAPAGGVTITLGTSAAQTATIKSTSGASTVTIAAGGSSAPVVVTGVQANTATLTAGVSSGGYTTASLGVTILPPGLTINLPHSIVVAPGQALPFPISIGAAAASAVSVSFTTSGGPGTATISPNPVVIPAGATAPTTAPKITGVAIGGLTVTGSATGYAPDTENATVQITLTFNPATLSVETGTTQNLTLSASSIAPTGGFSITLASADTTKAAVASPILIPAGSSTVSVPVKGVGAGNTTVTASAPGAVAAKASISVYAPPAITLYGPSGTNTFSIGKDGIVGMSGTLAVAAPAHNLAVTVTTPSTSSLLLSTTATGVGSHSITVTATAGSTSIPEFYAQATAASGTAVVAASATGYSNGTATATLTPSGFIVQGGTSTTTLAGTSPVYVYFAQLIPGTLAYSRTTTLRPGAAAITVPLKDSNTAVGTLGSSSVVFQPGDSQKSTTFQPVAAGTAMISFNGVPAGYSASSNDNTTTFTVTEPNTAISFCNGTYITGSGSVALGYNGVCAVTPQVATAAPIGGKTVTLSSNSANLLIATSATSVGTVGPVTVTIPAGGYSAPQVYLQVVSASGSAKVTETVPGYNPTTATVNFTPSGFIVQGGTSTTTFSGTSPVYVYFAQLDPATKDYVRTMTLRPGAATLNVPLKNTDTPAGVGTLAASSLTFSPGDSMHQTTFQPAGAGSAVIGFASTPAGYTAAANNATTTFTVTAPNSALSFCNGTYISTTGTISLGYNSNCAATPQVAAAAPKGGSIITLTSSNSAAMLLSTSATALGSASITVNIPAGSYSAPQVYVQSLSSTGSATITENIPGYNSTVTTVKFTPSGFIVQGGSSTTTFSAASPVYVSFAQLDPTTLDYTRTQTMRPGATAASVGLKNSNTSVGTLATASLVFSPGDSMHQTTFQPSAAGTATIGFTGTLAGYATPANNATTVFTVAAPNSALSFCNGSYISGTGAVSVGYNSQCGFTPQLSTAAPTGGRTVTLTSSNPAALLLSTSATATGSTTVTVTIPAGGYSASQVYLQALTAKGSAAITESVPGYNPTTATVNFAPSGFIVQGGTSTTTFSAASSVYVYFAQLDPTTLDYARALILRPGVGLVTVKLTDSNTAVGTLTSSSLVFNTGDSTHQTSFQPAGAGTAVIGFNGMPAGYTASSNNNTTSFTVTAPNSALSFCNGSYVSGTGAVSAGYNSQCAATPQLAVAAPAGGRTVTLTSNSANLLLSTSPTAVGTVGPITVAIPAGGYSGSQVYLQAAASTGTATITETVSGYNPTTATVHFTPSGFIVQGGTSTTTFSAASPLYVYFAQLDPTTLNYVGTLTMRPGATAVTVGLKETDTPSGIGSLGSTSLVFKPGDTTHQTTFQPAGTAAGTAVIGFTSAPAGYGTPSNNATTTFTVSAPTITVQSAIVGNYLQTTTYGYLGVPAPAGGRTVTIAAPASSSVLLSTSAAVKGTSTLTFNVAAGASSIPTFYVQSQGGGAGTVNLTVSAPGYTTSTTAITVYPSGFALQGSNFTTHVSDNPTTLTIVPAALDPMYLNIYAVQELIPNLPLTATGTLQLKVESGTGVGKFSLNSVTFHGNDNPNFLTSSFIPQSSGTALITITSSTGFTNASTEITATVVSP